MGDEVKKAAGLRLIHATTNPVKQVRALVTIQTPFGLRSYRIDIPVDDESEEVDRHIRGVLGAGLEFGVSVLDGSFERTGADD